MPTSMLQYERSLTVTTLTFFPSPTFTQYTELSHRLHRIQSYVIRFKSVKINAMTIHAERLYLVWVLCVLTRIPLYPCPLYPLFSLFPFFPSCPLYPLCPFCPLCPLWLYSLCCSHLVAFVQPR